MSETALDLPASGAIVDKEELARVRARQRQTIAKYVLPFLVMVMAVGGWHYTVTANDIPHYILPSPGAVFGALIDNWASMIESWWVTMTITGLALGLADRKSVV